MKLAVGKEGKKGRLEKDHEFELSTEEEIDIDPDSIRFDSIGGKRKERIRFAWKN